MAFRNQRSPALRWLAGAVIFAVIAALTFWVHLYEFNGINRWDSAAFLSIGKLLRRGLMLYRDLWDTKPPGIYLYQSAVFAVLPVEVWSLRLTDYLLYVATGVVFYRLCRVAAGWPLALGATALWLYLAHHPTFNVAGFYTEEYSAMCAIAAIGAAARYWRQGGMVWVVASGVGIAAAVIFKHPGIACALPAALLISSRRPLLALPLLAVSAALPLLMVVGYFWWHGALAPFLDCQFLHLLGQHGLVNDQHPKPLTFRIEELWQRTYKLLSAYPALLWPALFGGLVCLLRPTRFRLAALLWMVTDVALIAVQRFYYEHYYIQLFPSAVLVGVIGAGWLLQWQPGERRPIAAARLAACAVLVALAWMGLRVVLPQRNAIVARSWAALRAGPERWPHNPGGPLEAEIGRYLRERTAPDDRIFIYETGTALAVFWTADRLPASRYLFSIIPESSLTRQTEQLAELERTPPAYIAITGNSAYRYVTPFLLANYTLATVKWGDYRIEVWARNQSNPFTAGESSGLRPDAERGGLILQEPQAPVDAPLVEMHSGRSGTWTSPVIEVIGSDGQLAVDWSPRRNLALNPSGVGLPSVEVGGIAGSGDAKALLGALTRSGRWGTFPSPAPRTLTLRFGFPAIADRVVLRTLLTPPDTAATRFQLLGSADDDFTPLHGTWDGDGQDGATYRFAPRTLSALRIVATPAEAARPVALERVQVTAVGMGVAVRYRTGPTPDLASGPWVAVEDEEGPRPIRAQRYVQVQCDVWSFYQGRSPLLRSVQVGRLRFELDGTTAPSSPLRTASAPVQRVKRGRVFVAAGVPAGPAAQSAAAFARSTTSATTIRDFIPADRPPQSGGKPPHSKG